MHVCNAPTHYVRDADGIDLSHGEGWAVQRGEVGLASGVRRAVVYSGAGMYMSRANWASHGVPNGITDGTEARKQLVFQNTMPKSTAIKQATNKETLLTLPFSDTLTKNILGVPG